MAYADETKYSHSQNFWEVIHKSLRIATKELKAITSLHLYNGNVSKFLPELLDLPVDRIGVDAYTTNLCKFVGTSFKKFLELGIVNSKNSLVESPETIVKCTKQVIEKIDPNGLALVPNRPLELVPRQIAIKKIKSLANAVKIINQK